MSDLEILEYIQDLYNPTLDATWSRLYREPQDGGIHVGLRPAAAIESMRNETLSAIHSHSLAMALHLDRGFGSVKVISEQKE